MIDFVKLWVDDRGVIKNLRDNSLLSFTESFTRQGVNNGIIAEFHGMSFSIYHEKKLEIRGSFHKFWNSYIKNEGLHNWNDFSQKNLFDTIECFSNIFQLDINKTSIHNIEVGVNIALPLDFTSKEILEKFTAFGTKRFKEVPLSSPGYYKEASLENFYVKAYDKGTQYNRPEPLMRFEKKNVSMKAVPGIVMLNDLLDVGKINNLGLSLLQTFDNCLIEEPINANLLTAKERKVLDSVRLINQEKDWETSDWKTMSDKHRSRIRERYKKIVDKYGATVRPLVRSLIVGKWHGLSHHELVPGVIPTDRIHRDPLVPAASDSLIVVKPDQTEDSLCYFGPKGHLTEETTPPPPVENFRFCLVTGLDISKQGRQTKFVSKTTLLDLYDHNPSQFDRLADLYLSKKVRAEGSVEQCAYHIAHNIRNKAHNPAQNLRKRVMRSINNSPLFPDYGITLTEADKKMLDRFKKTRLEVPYK